MKLVSISIFIASLFVGVTLLYTIDPKGEADLVNAIIGASVAFAVAFLGFDAALKYAEWRDPHIFDEKQRQKLNSVLN